VRIYYTEPFTLLCGLPPSGRITHCYRPSVCPSYSCQ